MAKRIVTEVGPRVVWQSEGGRAVVLYHGPRDYEAQLDGKNVGYFKASYQAEHELGVLLHQEAEALAEQPQPTPPATTPARTVYTSPDGRFRVEREAPRQFVLYGDDRRIKTYDRRYKAELAGMIWLEEQERGLKLDLADEQAERDFVGGLEGVMEALPLLGDKKRQIGILRLTAAILAGDITTEQLEGVLEGKRQPAPEPEPERPLFREPDDFVHEIRIGELYGEPVMAHRIWDEDTGQSSIYSLSTTLNGLPIHAYPADGVDGDFLNIRLGEGLASTNDLHWHEWGKLRELATDPTDPMGTLMRWPGAPAPT